MLRGTCCRLLFNKNPKSESLLMTPQTCDVIHGNAIFGETAASVWNSDLVKCKAKDTFKRMMNTSKFFDCDVSHLHLLYIKMCVVIILF